LRRGDIVIVAAGSGFGGKPRPAVVIQSDQFPSSFSTTLCLFTSGVVDAPLVRLPMTPSTENGLTRTSWLMVDKIVTVPSSKIDKKVGRLASDDIARVNQALAVFLGLSG
jgi:mRNA interferase MazF